MSWLHEERSYGTLIAKPNLSLGSNMHLSYKYLFIVILLSVLSGCFFSKPLKIKLPDGQEKQLFAPKKMVKDMNYQEALEGKEYYEAVNNDEFTLKCAERMVALASDKEETAKALLTLAQGYNKQGDHKKAKQYAQDYQLYYPGTPEAKDAAYLAIQSQFLSTLGAGKDQTSTHKTIEQAELFLKRYENEEHYCKSVKDMVQACYKKLLDNELSVINTYVARNKYNKKDAPLVAASRRIEHIKKKLLPQVPQETERVKKLELALATLTPKKEAPAALSLESPELLKKYSTQLAQRDATYEAATKF